jgi:hypothetical protein
MSSWNQPGLPTTTPTGPPSHGTSSARGLGAAGEFTFSDLIPDAGAV